MFMEKGGYTYILTNKAHGTLYIGVTADLVRRIHQHLTGEGAGFSKRHRLTKLVWFQEHASIENAIDNEKQLKRWRRDWKINLIERANPNWSDLYPNITSP